MAYHWHTGGVSVELTTFNAVEQVHGDLYDKSG